jgi:hypothetical protein
MAMINPPLCGDANHKVISNCHPPEGHRDDVSIAKDLH